MDPAALLAGLEAGEPVLLPVDTLVGLAARADRPEAVERLFALKGRPADKPFSLAFRDLDQIEAWLSLDDGRRAWLRRLLPGPVTAVVDGSAALGRLRAEWAGSVGVRWPGPCPASELLAGLPWPLALTSANPSGGEDPRRLDDVDPALRRAVPLALQGEAPLGTGSTVVDLRGERPRILRAGALPADELDRLLGDPAR